MFVTIFAWNSLYACIEVALLVRFEMLVRFVMVCNMFCMIGIPNLIHLSQRGLLYMSGLRDRSVGNGNSGNVFSLVYLMGVC